MSAHLSCLLIDTLMFPDLNLIPGVCVGAEFRKTNWKLSRKKPSAAQTSKCKAVRLEKKSALSGKSYNFLLQVCGVREEE